MFQLLTGCRSVEIHGSAKYGYLPVRVQDVDLAQAAITLRDTKNRTDHRLLLSTQAMAIVRRRMAGLEPEDALFPVTDLRKTLQAINAKAGTQVLPHGLRATFASVAEPLVSASVLKRMLNHAEVGDVTLNHYIGRSDAQMRAGWQAVADFVEAVAAKAADGVPGGPPAHRTDGHVNLTVQSAVTSSGTASNRSASSP
jgi:integrase